MTEVLSYGGGRQTVAIVVLIAKGLLPKPDRIVIADTGREKQTTWDYLDAHVRPCLRELGLEVEIAPRRFAYVDFYGHNGDILVPVYFPGGKMRGWCSDEWKVQVSRRYLRETGTTSAINWVGFALEEKRRLKRLADSARSPWFVRFPLTELMLTTESCLRVVESFGWPPPPMSSCWMCPNMTNRQWLEIRVNRPPEFEEACRIDVELRDHDIANGGPGVYLHHSCVPLREANLDTDETAVVHRQCGLGTCFV